MAKVVKPGPDRTVWPGNPWTVQFHDPFKVRNHSMRKKHGPVQTTIQPSSSVNRDRFTQFERLPCFNSKTILFHPFFSSYTASFHLFFLTLSQKSLSVSSSLWNPLSITLGLFLNPHSLNHSLVSASLLCRCCTVAAQLRFLPYSLKVLITLSSLPLSLFAILTLSKSQSLSRLYLPRHRRSSDCSSLSHAHLCLSPLSPSQLTLCLVTVAVAVIWYFITSNLFFLC